MLAALDRPAGDPGRIHQEGLAARHAVEVAREQVAALLGCRPRSMIFTSGATESIATAVWGAVHAGAERLGVAASATHVVVPAVEHSAVRSAAGMGEHTVVGVDGRGRIDPDEALRAIGERTVLVHVQLGNHEVGTLQPVAAVVAGCRERGVLVHVDAAQAAGRVPIAFDDLGADLLSVSSHKLGGPAGVGALLVRRGLRVPPLLTGGDQERARRAGMEDVVGIAGFGAACAELDGGTLEAEAAVAAAQIERLAADAVAIDGVVRYGDPAVDGRLPHLLCVGIEDIEPQAVLLGLDRRGIAAHSGSACASESLEPSPVLEAMGVDAHRSLRLSVGWDTTDADIDAAVAALPEVIAELRALRP